MVSPASYFACSLSPLLILAQQFMVDRDSHRPTDIFTAVAFQVLTEVSERFGRYEPLLVLVRNALAKAVYVDPPPPALAGGRRANANRTMGDDGPSLVQQDILAEYYACTAYYQLVDEAQERELMLSNVQGFAAKKRERQEYADLYVLSYMYEQ